MNLSKRRLTIHGWGWLLAMLILLSYGSTAHGEANSFSAHPIQEAPARSATSLAEVIYKAGALGQQMDMLKRKSVKRWVPASGSAGRPLSTILSLV